MAVTGETLNLAAGMRVQLAATVDATTRTLVKAWARAWAEITTEWQAAAAAAIAAVSVETDGVEQWPSRIQLARLDALQAALNATRAHLDALNDGARVQITEQVSPIVDAAVEWQRRMTLSQLPPTPTDPHLSVTFNRVDPHAITAIVTRTTTQITALTAHLSVTATEAMRAEVVRGVTVGDKPRRAAARIVKRVNGKFEGGLTRALVIARTEMLDAHRAAAMAADLANPDVVTGWTWLATLDPRTCPACWAMNGTTHSPTEAGPNDHQQGRCARVPTTKSWRDLGFTTEEPVSVVPDAQAVFADLPAADQLTVMGPARLQLLQSGQIQWAELATTRTTPGWRDSSVVTPVRDLFSHAS